MMVAAHVLHSVKVPRITTVDFIPPNFYPAGCNILSPPDKISWDILSAPGIFYPPTVLLSGPRIFYPPPVLLSAPGPPPVLCAI